MPRTYKVSLRVLSALLLCIIILVSAGFWIVSAINDHRRWVIELDAMYAVQQHLFITRDLLLSEGFESNRTAQNWMLQELRHAWETLQPWSILDREHLIPLSAITGGISNLCGSCIIGLNSTERSILGLILVNIGEKLVAAYSNFMNYTGQFNYWEGPPLWYLGPSPPDDILLRQAVDLATSLEPY